MKSTTTNIRKNRRSRQGATIVLMVLLMTVILGMVAFAIEIGRMSLLRSEVQNAVDSGALAASLVLQVDSQDLVGAADAAEEFIQRNRVGSTVTIPEGAIQVDIGQWDSETGTFTATNTLPNAVGVFAQQNNEPFFFGRIFGHTTFGAPGSAIASSSANPLDIMMVLDLSGSMGSDGRIEALRNASPSFVTVIDDIGGEDHVGVMGSSADPGNYDPWNEGHFGTLYEPAGLNPGDEYHVGVLEADLTNNFGYLRSAVLSHVRLVDGKYGGGTGTGAGIRDAAHYLTNAGAARDEAKKVIVMMSDGQANKPSGNGSGYALSMAQYAEGLGVTIFTISLGSDADVDLMRDIAAAGNGSHFDATGSGSSYLTTILTSAFEGAARAAKRTALVQ